VHASQALDHLRRSSLNFQSTTLASDADLRFYMPAQLNQAPGVLYRPAISASAASDLSRLGDPPS